MFGSLCANVRACPHGLRTVFGGVGTFALHVSGTRYMAIGTRIIRYRNLREKMPVDDVELHERPPVEKLLLAVDFVQDFHLEPAHAVGPNIRSGRGLLLVVSKFLRLVVRRAAGLIEISSKRLLRLGNVHRLPLGQTIGDYRVAVEFVILRPLRVAPHSPQAIGVQVLLNYVDC
jgi:hypothetical protein